METGRQRMEADMRLADEVRQVRDRIATEVARRVVGQADAIEQLLVALFAEGHGLLIGVPSAIFSPKSRTLISSETPITTRIWCSIKRMVIPNSSRS